MSSATPPSPVEFKEELDAHLQRTGQSLSQWIQSAFAGREGGVEEAQEIYRRGLTEGAQGMLKTLERLRRMGNQTK